MKNRIIRLAFLSVLVCVLPGCVSLPPLIVVEHKDKPDDAAVAKRLDSIDQRLGQLEQKNAQK